MTNALEIVTAYMEQTKKDLVASYLEKGLKASGKYEKGLSYTVEDTGHSIKAVMESEGHVWFMEEGRKPNKKQTAKQARSLGHILEQWVKDKGISVNPYAAAWKIVREGITVPNRFNPGDVVEDVVTNEWFDGLVAQMNDNFIRIITTDVERLFRK
jgi:hypothetical protein